MLSRSPGAPFPFEAVRDLLGLIRGIFAARKTAGAQKRELDRTAAVGESLRMALELATESSPNTVGMRAAWSRAEGATRDAGDLVKLTDEARPIVEAAARRMRR